MFHIECGSPAYNRGMRIVSLLPSATEIICRIGLRDSLVGVTHECDWPRDVIGLPRVTRTLIAVEAASREIDRLVRERLKSRQALYSLDFDALQRLKPDLIVTQALCDVCAVAEDEVRDAACRLPGSPRVLNLEPTTLAGVLDSMLEVGRAADCLDRAEQAVAELKARIESVRQRTQRIQGRLRVTMLEWIDPLFSCGHWTPEIVELAGGIDGHGRRGERSRQLEWREVLEWQPEAIFIACCGFDVERACRDLPILERLPGWHDLPCVRSGRVYVADGSAYFNRPGPRLIDSLEILAHALHPQVHPRPVEGAARVIDGRQ